MQKLALFSLKNQKKINRGQRLRIRISLSFFESDRPLFILVYFFFDWMTRKKLFRNYLLQIATYHNINCILSTSNLYDIYSHNYQRYLKHIRLMIFFIYLAVKGHSTHQMSFSSPFQCNIKILWKSKLKVK